MTDPRRASERAFDLVELARRLANVVRLATVHEVDHASARLRARYDLDQSGDAVLTGWLPWLTRRAGGDSDWWAPEAGEQVVLLSPSGDLPQAVALPAIYSAMRPAPADGPDQRLTVFSDGARILYDRAAHALSATLPDGATASLRATSGVSITGNLAVTGDVTATGDVSDAAGSMQEMRDTYNTHDHPSADPPADTGGPNQEMD